MNRPNPGQGRVSGELVQWDDARGFGRIRPQAGGALLFVHISAFPRGAGRPQPGQRLSYAAVQGPKGPRAEAVQPLDAPAVAATRAARRVPPNRRARTGWGLATWLLIPASLLGYLLIAVLWRPPAWVPALYLGLSLLTIAAYAADKAAAQRGGWRTPESTLHLLALAGGWPGALLAQQWLRHKSRKAGFRAVFWATVLLNLLALLWLVTPLRGLLGAAVPG